MVALFLPLWIFREFYSESLAWVMVLALALLAIVVFAGEWTLYAALYRSRWRNAIKETSFLSRILTGHFGAFVPAAILTFVSIPILVGQIRLFGHYEMMALMAVSLLAGGLFLLSQSGLTAHFHSPFNKTVSATCVTWLLTLAFIPAIAWMTANGVQPPEVKALDIIGSLIFSGKDEPPAAEGFLPMVLEYIYAYESAKLWVLARLHLFEEPVPRLAMIVYWVDAALTGFVIARATIAINLFILIARNKSSDMLET